ncbi:hypothetical protein MFRU_019g01550 [Monilinia fructicola]|nr:hypothetical protein MFRU_019g01550 [Monilinia fructicola]
MSTVKRVFGKRANDCWCCSKIPVSLPEVRDEGRIRKFEFEAYAPARIWRLEIWMGGSKYGPIREVEFKARGSAEEDEE